MNANDIVTSDDATLQVEQTVTPTVPDSNLKPSIVFMSGYDTGRVIILERPQTEVGRASSCHIQIQDQGVSRRHLILDMAPDGVQAIDLRSRNGVYVNGQRVERCWLNNQDVVRIGSETMLRFSLLSANEIEFLGKMYEAAVLDSLTRIYNRRYFFGLISQYIERKPQEKRRLALIIIDLDHFKMLNDTYGHQVGDIALRHISSLICSMARVGDKVCRFGGEEFTILLNEVDLPEATSIAERVRATVECSPLLHEGAVIPMTVSIGVATLDHASGNPDRLFALADARMYEAKNAGRNQVCNGPVPSPC